MLWNLSCYKFFNCCGCYDVLSIKFFGVENGFKIYNFFYDIIVKKKKFFLWYFLVNKEYVGYLIGMLIKIKL